MGAWVLNSGLQDCTSSVNFYPLGLLSSLFFFFFLSVVAAAAVSVIVVVVFAVTVQFDFIFDSTED